MKRLLFICSKNQLRSPTAEAVFAEYPDVDVLSAGLNKDSPTPVTPDELQWADTIFVMENAHKARLRRNFSLWLKDKRVICLDIPDNYEFMAPKLIQLLERKVSRFL
ncbi:MAG: low molecular weight protein tyrosine phosphatase family protein [Cyanobacteria bacterium P01_E01_bin.34]